MESLLDCLVWATNKFGQLSTVIGKVQDAASSMAESSGLVNPKLDAQHTSLLRMSDGILALAANIKVNGDQGAPLLAGVKAIQKQLENCAWQVSGSGAKLVNVSVKELLMSSAKVLSECNAQLAKGVDHSQRTYEGVIALNENVKEGNQLLKELIEGQRISLRHAAQNLAQQQASTPPPVPAPPVSMGSQGASTIPAAFQNPALGVGKIPGTSLPQPPAVPERHPGVTPTTPMDDPAPGFKKVKLADGSTMTIPKGWQPDPNL